MTADADNAQGPKNSSSKTDNAASEANAGATTATPEKKDNYGYDLYPERRGGKAPRNWTKTFFLMEGRESMENIRCEKNVYNCIRTSPLVKLMMGALKSSGCGIDIRRHISCEVCDPSVSGGYDPETNQIVVCQNNSKNPGFVQGILAHEMIHMFDFCRNNLDFKNIDHLACTEIRAANLTHCSFLSSCTQGDSSFFNVRKTHEDCVKNKAYMSIVTVRNVTLEEARAAIERVFPTCYADMEPVGRRLRPRSKDMARAYTEGPYYGVAIVSRDKYIYSISVSAGSPLPRSFPTVDLYEMLDEASFRERAKTNFKSHLETIATLNNNLTGIDNEVPRPRNSILTLIR